jgi:filamentous hemagglutinin family protein
MIDMDDLLQTLHGGQKPPVSAEKRQFGVRRSLVFSGRSSSSLRSSILYTPALVLGALTLAPSSAEALPQNGTVVGGSATITQTSPARTDITQHTGTAIIDWKSFGVGVDEHVNFIQPDSQSLAINRVTGNDASVIAGRLTANGNVWVLNPNGVMFTNTARVDVGGLLATTSDISNADAMAGRYEFFDTGSTASVINEGQISIKDGGLAAFVAPHVENNGIITANLGKIALAGGDSYTVDLYGDGLISLAVSDKVIQVSNAGEIHAAGGKVALTAKTAAVLVDNVINMDGVIEANGADQTAAGEIIIHGGDNGIVSVTGTATATNDHGTGGKVDVLGEKVGLFDDATIDVSGSTGGGEIHIGGDYQGQGDRQTASRTYIGSNVTLKANATDTGDGGTIITWADETTQYYGYLEAKGGLNGGDGGFAEVSGKEKLAFHGTADLTGDTNGTLLLDPRDITIVAGVDGSQADDSNPLFDSNVAAGDDTGVDWTLSAGALEALFATGNVALAAEQDIFVNAALDGNNRNFTLDAGRDIEINAELLNFAAISISALSNVLVSDDIAGVSSITAGGAFTGSGSLTRDCGSCDLTIEADSVSYSGDIDVDRRLSVVSDDIDLWGTIYAASWDVRLDARNTTGTIGIGDNAAGADMTITARTLNSMLGEVEINRSGTSLGDITINDSSDIAVGHNLLIHANYDASQDIVIASNVTSGRSMTLVASNNITVAANLESTLNDIGVSAGNDIDIDGDLITNTGGVSLSAGNDMMLDGDVNRVDSLTIGRNFSGSGSLTRDCGSCDLTIEADSVSYSGDIDVDRRLSVVSDNIDLWGTIYAASWDVRLDARNTTGTIGVGDNAEGADMTITARTLNSMLGEVEINRSGTSLGDITINDSSDIAVGHNLLIHANAAAGQSIHINSSITNAGGLELNTHATGTVEIGGNITLRSATMDVNGASTIDINGNDVLLASDNFELAQSVSSSSAGNGSIGFSAVTTTRSVGLNDGTADENFTTAWLASTVDASVGSIQIGDINNTGGLTVGTDWGDALVQENLRLVSGANMTISSALSETTNNNLSLFAAGNINITNNIQMDGAGTLALVAGWNGVSTDVATVTGDDNAYGNTSGSITIGSTANSTAVASRLGNTIVAAEDVTVQGGNSAREYSTIGWGSDSATTSDSDIHLYLAGDLVVQGGSTNATWAKVGHGGWDPAGSSDFDMLDHDYAGDITIHRADTVRVRNGNNASAIIGHGGYRAQGDLTGNISLLDVVAVEVVEGTGWGGESTIGHNIGYSTNDGQILSGEIYINASGDITVRGGGSSSPKAARIGHGGVAMLGDISVSGDITVNGNNLLLQAGSGAEGTGGAARFAEASIGHGEVDRGGYGTQQSEGSRQGDITVTVAGELSLVDHANGNWAHIGHSTTTPGGVTNANVLISAGSMDFADDVVDATTFLFDNANFASRMARNLAGGAVNIVSTGADLTLGTANWSDSGTANVLTFGGSSQTADIDVTGAVTFGDTVVLNTAGDISIGGTWNSGANSVTVERAANFTLNDANSMTVGDFTSNSTGNINFGLAGITASGTLIAYNQRVEGNVIVNGLGELIRLAKDAYIDITGEYQNGDDQTEANLIEDSWLDDSLDQNDQSDFNGFRIGYVAPSRTGRMINGVEVDRLTNTTNIGTQMAANTITALGGGKRGCPKAC